MSGGHGGRREGAGRPVGSVSKTTAEIRALARVYGPAAIERLARLSGLLVDAQGNPVPGAGSEATQALAIKELLDRGYGRATQHIEGDVNSSVSYVIRAPAPVKSAEEWLKLHAPSDSRGSTK
jgi:hypothetical protein